MQVEIIPAQWTVPSNVHAFTTTREGGVSEGPYRSFNLGGHVGDSAASVAENRSRALEKLGLPGEPAWLSQVHGDHIVCVDDPEVGVEADGSFAMTAGAVCAILTADCLPLFLCNAAGSRVGLFHIGWRGLARRLVRKAAKLFAADGEASAWLGPAIGPAAFEIGNEVKVSIETALNCRPDCFVPAGQGKWLANLYKLTAGELEPEGIMCSYDDSLCTFSDPSRFFSHRRRNPCGRMASLIWMA